MKRFVSLIVGMLIFLGTISLYRLYQDSSPTPNQAVNDYIFQITKNSPQKIESLNVVASTPANKDGSEQILLFQANDRRLQTHIAGYATIKKSLFGWYVDEFQMSGKSRAPYSVIAGLNWSNGIPVVYGQVFLTDVASVEAVFSDPNQGEVKISNAVAQGSFAIFGTPHSQLTMLKLLDGNGNVLNN